MRELMRILKVLPCALILIGYICAEQPCIPAKFENESIVCVCNATYCDTVPQIGAMSSDVAYVYTTSRDGKRFDLTTEAILKNGALGDFDVLLMPKPTETLQTIEGFGGGLTDSAAHVINGLTKNAQDKLLDAYFSPTALGYTLVRVPMGCTDFSLREYSFDPYPGDYSMKNFRLTDEEIKGKIPLIKRANNYAEQDLKLIACAWAAPAWMKVDGKVLSGGDIKYNCYDAWATYQVRFLEAYRENGLQFWGISTGNEPGLAVLSPHWGPSALASWITNFFGPKLETQFSQSRLLLMDDLPKFLPNFYSVMSYLLSNRYLYGWAVHPYGDINEIRPNLDYAHKRFPGKPILSTEFTAGVLVKPSVSLGSWTRAEDYAIRILNSLNNWATGWIDWNIALDMDGGPTWVGNNVDSAIIVNSDEFYKQPSFYIQGHFSRFLVPGSMRINFTMTPAGVVDATAVITPQMNVVIVILNRGKSDAVIAIRRPDLSLVHLTAPAQSIITVLYKSL